MSFFSDNSFYLILQIIYIITVIGVVIVVISENRNPVKTLAWVLVLLLIPVGGLVIYYFFGEDHRKKRLISRKMHKKLNRNSLYSIDRLETLHVPNHYKRLVNLLNRTNAAPLYGNNELEFYSSAESMFASLFEEIRKAEKFIHIQFFIFMDDSIGQELGELLVKKAQQGVEVRLMYDDVGSWKAKNKFFRQLEKRGVKVGAFLKVKLPVLTSRVNYRNHRKVVVIDGEVGFMGGMNVADRYLKGINGGIWRDCHFKVVGKAVYGLETSFAIDWYSITKEFLSSSKYFPDFESKGENIMQIVTSGPTGEYKEIHQGIFHAIMNATEYVYIQTPYFIPTDNLMLALQTAALSGVEVRIMLPAKADTVFVHIATLSFIKDLLKAKVKVDFYEKGFLHSKLLVIDDSLAIVGSANMDVRSFEHNFEIEAFMYDSEAAKKVKDIYFNDLSESKEMTFDEWLKRPWYKRFASSVLRLFTPLL
ncbi:MAG: cardiolipin synthase [Dysgonomonas sp.]